MKELLDANTILLAFALDPFGRWGPITQNFLSISTAAERLTFRPDRPNATIMYNRATTHPAPTAILHAADSFWSLHKTRRFFGHSHTAPTPQIQTIQNLGIGITKAFSLHLRNSIQRSTHQHCTTHQTTSDSPDSTDSPFDTFSFDGST